MRNIFDTKGLGLTLQDLRRFNGKEVMLFSGQKGIIRFPLVISKQRGEFFHLHLETIFHEIKEIRMSHIILASRHKHGAILVTHPTKPKKEPKS